MKKIIVVFMLLGLTACATSSPREEVKRETSSTCVTAPGGGPMFSICN